MIWSLVKIFVIMPCQVGNEAARDAAKHTLSYIIRAAVGEIIPAAGPILSIHYDKRGAKISVQYKGEEGNFVVYWIQYLSSIF